MARALRFAIVWVTLLAAPAFALSSAEVRQYARLRTQCDQEGKGKSCYRYGMARWKRLGFVDQNLARRYLMRGCELKYQKACHAYDVAAVRTKVQHRRNVASAAMRCFQNSDLQTAKLSPASEGKLGQSVRGFTANSFWSQAGFREGDVLLKVNNVPIHSPQDISQSFSIGGRQLGLEVLRHEDEITLWYNCGPTP